MKKILAALVTALFLGGCASGVKHHGNVGSIAPLATPEISSISLSLNDQTKGQIAENTSFSTELFLSTLQQAFESRDLVKADAGQSLEVELTDLRARSTFSAIMFGFMAGNDRISGIVRVKDASGRVSKHFEVSASYALGGLAGGQSNRMNWLYDTFAKHAVESVAGSEWSPKTLAAKP